MKFLNNNLLKLVLLLLFSCPAFASEEATPETNAIRQPNGNSTAENQEDIQSRIALIKENEEELNAELLKANKKIESLVHPDSSEEELLTAMEMSSYIVFNFPKQGHYSLDLFYYYFTDLDEENEKETTNPKRKKIFDDIVDKFFAKKPADKKRYLKALDEHIKEFTGPSDDP